MKVPRLVVGSQTIRKLLLKQKLFGITFKYPESTNEKSNLQLNLWNSWLHLHPAESEEKLQVNLWLVLLDDVIVDTKEPQGFVQEIRLFALQTKEIKHCNFHKKQNRSIGYKWTEKYIYPYTFSKPLCLNKH